MLTHQISKRLLVSEFGSNKEKSSFENTHGARHGNSVKILQPDLGNLQHRAENSDIQHRAENSDTQHRAENSDDTPERP